MVSSCSCSEETRVSEQVTSLPSPRQCLATILQHKLCSLNSNPQSQPFNTIQALSSGAKQRSDLATIMSLSTPLHDTIMKWHLPSLPVIPLHHPSHRTNLSSSYLSQMWLKTSQTKRVSYYLYSSVFIVPNKAKYLSRILLEKVVIIVVDGEKAEQRLMIAVRWWCQEPDKGITIFSKKVDEKM